VKVLLSAFQCCPGLGSEPGTGWHWVTTLADLGHEVTVLTTPHFRETIAEAGRQDVDFRFVAVPRSSLAKVSDLLAIFDYYRRWQDEALRQVVADGRRYDVAHHVTWGGLHLGSQLWRLPVPLVYGPVGGGQTAPRGYWRYFGREWPVEAMRTASTGPLLTLNGRCRDTVRNSAVTLVCNSATEAATRRLGAADVRFMLADGLPAEWLGEAHQPPGGTPVVLFVGRLIPRKAPLLAVEAFARLRRIMPARLVIAGDGPLRAQVQAAVRRHGIAADVDLIGRVGLDDVKELYDTASVLLFPSLRESFGAPILEALGRGLPTVALDLHGIADADVGAAAVKVPLPPHPRELPGRLASALTTVLTDGNWQSRSAAATSWASNWLWPRKAAIATELYQEIVAGRSGTTRYQDLARRPPMG
jgi:glycosyltransferase involved in cell wall biosynthesis